MVSQSCWATPYRKLRTNLVVKNAARIPIDKACNQKPTGLTQDHAKNILTLRTQGETHSNLSRALAHAVAQQAVESGGGDQNGSDGEDPQQSRGQRLTAELVVNMLRHGLDYCS